MLQNKRAKEIKLGDIFSVKITISSHQKCELCMHSMIRIELLHNLVEAS